MQCATGDEEKDDEDKPANEYTGTLTLTYAREFPTFNASVSIEVDVYEMGDVLLSSPNQVPYHGVEEKVIGEAKVKIDETGTITVTSLNGTWKKIDGEEYLEISANVLIDGTSQVWAWTGSSWLQTLNQTFTDEDPIDMPLLFSITDAITGEATFTATKAGAYGSATYSWTLGLIVKP
jgi:hypothetical protein